MGTHVIFLETKISPLLDFMNRKLWLIIYSQIMNHNMWENKKKHTHFKITENLWTNFCKECFQILVTFLKWFLDGIPAYVQPTHLIFGLAKAFLPYQKSNAIKITSKAWLTFENTMYILALKDTALGFQRKWKSFIISAVILKII